MATPAFYVHCLVDADGRLVKRDLHQIAQGDPFLFTSPKGEVAVVNSVPYDPKAVEAQRKQTRKASDRPAFLYE